VVDLTLVLFGHIWSDLRCFRLNFQMLFADLYGISIGVWFMFLLVNGGRPLYLFEYLVFSRSERTLRNNSQSIKYMVGSVLARIRVWNSLPILDFYNIIIIFCFSLGFFWIFINFFFYSHLSSSFIFLFFTSNLFSYLFVYFFFKFFTLCLLPFSPSLNNFLFYFFFKYLFFFLLIFLLCPYYFYYH
jgi:hypothetical protein